MKKTYEKPVVEVVELQNDSIMVINESSPASSLITCSSTDTGFWN